MLILPNGTGLFLKASYVQVRHFMHVLAKHKLEVEIKSMSIEGRFSTRKR
jgi:hypothetical protein